MATISSVLSTPFTMTEQQKLKLFVFNILRKVFARKADYLRDN